jgi:hypothetical protein
MNRPWRTAKGRLYLFIPLIGLLILMMSLAGMRPAVAQNNLFPLNLVKNAVRLEDRLRLTADQKLQTGAAWLPAKQSVQGGFEATFQWQILKTRRAGADGFAFVIQNANGLALGNGGGGIGYNGIPNSLAVEFDTLQNPPEEFGGTLGDPNDNHVSVQTRGTLPNSANPTFSLGSTTAIPLLADGNVHTAKVAYVPGTLTIFLDDLTKPVLTVPVDLRTKLRLDEGKAWIGFTAATGGRSQAHDILSFSFVGTEEAQINENSNNFKTQLDGGQEIPLRTTHATGEASFQLRDETQIDFTFTLSNIQNITAAHIHCAPAGENGAVGVTLFGPVDPGGGAVDSFSTAGTIQAPDPSNGCGWADVGAVGDAMRSGTAYVNVHTDDGKDPADTGAGDFPAGEVRGQIEVK